MDLYKSLIRDVPDYPKPGIVFKDITPLLGHHDGLSAAMKAMAEPFRGDGVNLVIGMESRGFIFAPSIALELGCGFAPVRKPGKLPCATESINYDLEYGSDSLEIHRDAIEPGMRVLIVDDVIATGGTAAATKTMVQRLGGTVVGFSFLIELTFLSGVEQIPNDKVCSVWRY